MDLNYYLLREQIERMRADAARDAAARAVHARMAELYRERIEDYRTVRAAPSVAAAPPLARG